MSLERLQCPSCGASVSYEGRGEFFCSYCSAHLKVKTGALGNPMAVLDSIKDDTSVLAKQAAMRYLETELQRVREEHQRLSEEYRSPHLAKVQCSLHDTLFRDIRHEQLLAARERIGRELTRLGNEAGEISRKIAALKADINGMVEGM